MLDQRLKGLDDLQRVRAAFLNLSDIRRHSDISWVDSLEEIHDLFFGLDRGTGVRMIAEGQAHILHHFAAFVDKINDIIPVFQVFYLSAVDNVTTERNMGTALRKQDAALFFYLVKLLLTLVGVDDIMREISRPDFRKNPAKQLDPAEALRRNGADSILIIIVIQPGNTCMADSKFLLAHSLTSLFSLPAAGIISHFSRNIAAHSPAVFLLFQ